MSHDFASILSPVDSSTFVAEYWEQRPLHISRHDASYFDTLLSLPTLDFVLATHVGEADFPLSALGWRIGDEANRPDRKPSRAAMTAAKAYDLLAKGATLRIGAVPRYVEAVKLMADSFERELNTDIAVNAYVTPRASQAFGAHFDCHDVYILQIHGRKHWRIYEPPVPLPMEVLIPGRAELFAARPSHREQVYKPMPRERVREITLETGDALYVPRGYGHEAATGDALSVHLTVAAPVITWYEVLLAALPRAIARSEPLRRGLAPGFATDARVRDAAGSCAPDLVDALHSALLPEDLRVALDELATQVAFSRRPVRPRLIEEVDAGPAIDLDTRLRVRPSLVHRVDRVGAQLYLVHSGQSIELPIRAASMVEHMREGRTFRVRDLRTRLGDASRVLLSRMLVEKGFLQIEEDQHADDEGEPRPGGRGDLATADLAGGMGPDP